MPRQNEPPSAEAASPVAVRRAVAVPGPGQDPGDTLAPRVPATTATPPVPAPEPAPRTEHPEGKKAKEKKEKEKKEKKETAEERGEERREQKKAEEEKAEEGRQEEQEPVAGQAAEAPVAVAAAAAAPSPLPGVDKAAAEPAEQPSGRPRRPLLAAAGIAGALLISVPFLVMAALGDDDDRSVSTAPAGGTTLDPGAAGDELPADYAAESPSPSASKSAAASKSPSPAGVQAAPQGAEEPTEEKEPAAEKTTAAAKAKKKKTTTTTKKAAGPTARELANAASSQSAVLLKNTSTGKCADLPAYGKGSADGPVTQYICRDGGSDNQQWNLNVADASGGPDGASLFVVKNVKDGLCFDLPNYGSVAKGTQLTEYHCNTTRADNQLWYLEPRAGGTYALRNLVSNLCLGVNGGQSAGDDARLQVMTCGENEYTAQRWVFS
ncbi:RICIN domain-containing protein [Streptomyces sp. NPDC023723]|uniref:RICIN domain-containing protein n=1 Tax=Streptomyces sp. NPDC023723 TaxID=3154323 RepID=UPI0034004256